MVDLPGEISQADRAGVVRFNPAAHGEFETPQLGFDLILQDPGTRQTYLVTTALRTVGITAAVLGGLSVEHTLYGGTGARQFNDIDLLISPQHPTRTSTILHNLGYHPTPTDRGSAPSTTHSSRRA
jgi:Uncharacterised nucleotidyltransferase